MTGYILLAERDAQAGIFLAMFYVIAGLAALLGAGLNKLMDNRSDSSVDYLLAIQASV